MTTERKTLKALREERKWNQIEVAYRVHVSLSTISNLETGRHLPHMKLAQDIAALFGVSLDSIEWVKREGK